jgi:hypothetical protein
MSDKTTKTSTSVYDIASALNQYLPQLSSSITDSTNTGAYTDWVNTGTYSPYYSALQTTLYGSQAPKLAQTAREIDAADKLSGAQADLNVLNTTGQSTVSKTKALDELVNPEYYTTRANTSNTINQLLSGNLTDAEREEINRSLLSSNADAGTLGVGSNINTVGNAMTFGKESLTRQTTGAQLANSFLPTSTRDLTSTYNLAKGTKADSSGGTSQFKGVSTNLGSSGTNSANNIVSSVFGTESNNSTNKANSSESVSDYISLKL